MKRPFSPEEFKEIYSKAPRLCVDIVLKTSEGVVLLLRNLPSWRGKWHLPGGTVLYGEKIADTIRRVAEEELGVSVSVQKLLGYIEFPSEEKERGFGHTVSMAFLCSTNKETALRHNEEALELKVFKELPPGLIEEQSVFLASVWHELGIIKRPD